MWSGEIGHRENEEQDGIGFLNCNTGNDADTTLKEIFVLYYSGPNQTTKCDQRTIRHFR